MGNAPHYLRLIKERPAMPVTNKIITESIGIGTCASFDVDIPAGACTATKITIYKHSDFI